MERWSDGFEIQYSNTPVLQHSILFARRASKFFFRSGQTQFLSDPLD